MKKKKKIKRVPPAKAAGAAAAHIRALLGQAAPRPSPPLGHLVPIFLFSTSQLHGADYHGQLGFALKQLAAKFGHQPINQVNRHDIGHLAVSNPRWGPRTRKLALGCIKTFFGWARDEGLLPRHQPTAADLLNLRIKSLPPRILPPPGLKQLLSSTQDPDILMPTVFFAFAGPLVAELQRLARGDIEPGRGILVRRTANRNARLVPMSAALDAWLSPFYECATLPFVRPSALRKFRRWARALNLRFLPRILRYTFIAARQEQTGSAVQVAREAGLQPPFDKQFIGIMTQADADELLSVTPAKVGLRNWRRIVAEYLARNP